MRKGQNGTRPLWLLASLPRLVLQAGFAWLACASGATAAAQAPAETVIYGFASFPKGANPYAPLFRDANGDLYGTTNQGGEANVGVVFKQSASGYKVLYSFKGGTDGANPDSGVVLDGSGNIYGTTYLGGAANAGVVYKLTPAGQETLLYTFTGGADGANPYAGVTLDPAGNLYGTTYQGGSANLGVVYELSAGGQETVLHSFTGSPDGANPYAGVISDGAGNFFGTTYGGGSNNTGSVYKLVSSGEVTVLHSFPSQNGGGAAPYSGVVRDSNGNLYGTTGSTPGAVYELSAAGSFTLVHSFGGSGVDPTDPRWGVVLDSAGDLYGTTEHGGTAGVGVVYKLDAAGGLKVLYQFPGGQQSGAYANFPNAGVVLDSEGNIYGTTPYGGVEGMIFMLNPSGRETTLYDFEGAPGGTEPKAGVSLSSAGILYGSTVNGGPSNVGVVYKVDLAGHEAALYSFTGGADGAYPQSDVVLDSSGNVYGTTYGGGSASGAAGLGVVYTIDAGGQETVLHTFTGGADGEYPAGVVRDAAGNLYGAASGGVAGGGVVYKLDPSGQQTVLYAFTGGADGAGPGDVILDPAGNLYGTTYGGGTAGFGVVYKLSPAGQETVLYTFPGGPDGAAPVGGVTRDSEGNLYGTTTLGGGAAFEAGSGVVFELDADGGYAVLYRFTGGADGGNPFAGVARDPAGNLYGTANAGGEASCGGGCGVVYKVETSGRETVLYSFTGGADGANPSAGLLADSTGNLYGTTTWGGKGTLPGSGSPGAGVVYKISAQ